MTDKTDKTEQTENGSSDPAVRAFWHRPSFVAPALAAVLSGAVVLGVTVTRSGEVAAAGGDRPLLERIAGAAEKRSEQLPVRDDQFVYVKSQDDYIEATFDDTCPVPDHDLTEFEMWRSVDGTRWGLHRSDLGKPGDSGTYEEKVHPKTWANEKAPADYRELEALPTDPDAMYAWLHKGENPRARSHDSAYLTATTILSDNIVPPKVAAALFRAVAKLPGVTVVGDVRDALGRSGVAIGRTDKGMQERIDWIFDEKTLEYLGERRLYAGSATSGRCGSNMPGDLLTSKAITEQAVVDKAGERP